MKQKNIILRPWPICATTVCTMVGLCTSRMATSLRPKEPLPVSLVTLRAAVSITLSVTTRVVMTTAAAR